MNLTDMKILLGLYIEDTGENRWDATKKTVILNRAQEVAQNLIDAQDELYFTACQDVNVVADTDSYEFSLANFASTFKDLVHAERLVPGNPPIRARVVDFARRHEEKLETPRDNLIYLRGMKIGVVAPSDAYELRVWYIKKIADLSVGADISEIPPEGHNFVVLHAARLVHLSENRDFSRWEAEYSAELDRLKESAGIRQRAGAKYVHVDPED